MTPAEREELEEIHEAFWPPFDLDQIEAELAALIDEHGDALSFDSLRELEPAEALLR